MYTITFYGVFPSSKGKRLQASELDYMFLSYLINAAQMWPINYDISFNNIF